MSGDLAMQAGSDHSQRARAAEYNDMRWMAEFVSFKKGHDIDSISSSVAFNNTVGHFPLQRI